MRGPKRAKHTLCCDFFMFIHDYCMMFCYLSMANHEYFMISYDFHDLLFFASCALLVAQEILKWPSTNHEKR